MSSEGSYTAFLTTEEVLGCLKVNPRTIYRLIKTGELPAVRIGRQWRFRRTDLDDWIARQRTAASEASGRQVQLSLPHRGEHAGGYLETESCPTSARRGRYSSGVVVS